MKTIEIYGADKKVKATIDLISEADGEIIARYTTPRGDCIWGCKLKLTKKGVWLEYYLYPGIEHKLHFITNKRIVIKY